MSTPRGSKIPDFVLQNILDALDESDRLKALTNEELVMECLQDPSTDCPVVEEMMDRLWPGWDREGH